MAHVVIDLNDQRPVWAQPAWFSQELREALPDDWTLDVMETPSEGTGDGSTGAHPAVLECAAGAPVAPDPDAWSAGVGSSLTPEMIRRDLLFTNSAGIHGPPMAEAVLGMIFHFSRGFDFAQANKARRAWNTGPFYAADAPL